MTQGCPNVYLCDSFLCPIHGFGKTWLLSLGEGGAHREHVRGEERGRRSMEEGLDDFWTKAWDPRMPDFVCFSPPC